MRVRDGKVGLSNRLRRKYPSGRKVSNEEMSGPRLKRAKFHGEWNYVIQPRPEK